MQSTDLEALLAAVHRRLDGGLDISTFGNAQEGTTGVEIKWFRERWLPAGGDTLEEALRDVLRQADEADADEAEEIAARLAKRIAGRGS